MREIKKIHFVLSPALAIENIKTEIDTIKIWALTNPSKKIVIWYDFLADSTQYYIDRSLSDHIRTFNEYDKIRKNNFLNHIDNVLINKYLEKLGGASLFNSFIEDYRKGFEQAFQQEIQRETGRFKNDPRFNQLHITSFFNDIEQGLKSIIDNSNFTTREELIERNLDPFPTSFIEGLRTTKGNIFRKYIFSENFPESQYGENIEIENLYDHFDHLFQHESIYKLYLFEIFYNRNITLAKNLLTYILGIHYKGDLIISTKALPKLSPHILINESQERETTALVLKELESRKIIGQDYPREYTLDQVSIPEIENKIRTTKNEELFVSIKNVNDHPIYSYFKETEGDLHYLMFSNERVSQNDIEVLRGLIYQKRYRQIQWFLLNKLEGLFRTSIFKHFNIRNDLEKSLINGMITQFREGIFQHFRINNIGVEYVRHLSSRFSSYTMPISEATGSKLWSANNITPIELDFLSKEEGPWKILYKNAEKNLLDLIHQDRMRSNFDLDIFIYIHQEGTPPLEYTRYPSYSKKGILFTYEPDKDNQKIRFKESGIIIKTPQGERPIEASQVKEYIKNNLSSEKKIRIQISGHSHPDYEFEQTTDGVVVKKVEQTVGGLRIQELNHLFTQWFRETLSGISVDRLIFVACNLARYKDTDIETLEFLPKDSFLERFIDNFNNEGIRIKQITASDGTVSNPSETGRLFRLQRNPETGEEIFSYRESPSEVRKLLINTEKPDAEMHNPEMGEAMEIDHNERGGRYRCKAIKFDTDLTSDQILSNQFRLSENIFDISDPIRHPEVLEVPLEAAKISNELVKVSRANQEGHRIVGSDAMALVSSMQENPGKVLIIDIIPEKIEAVRFALRMATVFDDPILWKTFLKSYFPKAYKAIESYITPEAFNRLLDNIFSAKIVFTNVVDLTKVDAYKPIKNYLEIETGHSSIGFIYTSDQENDISRRVLVQEMERSFSSEDDAFALERELILKRRQFALEGFQKNLKALMQDDTHLIRLNNNNEVSLSDRAHIDSEWKISSSEPLELLGRDVSHAESFAETYHMARDFHKAFQDLIASHPDKITSHHVPLLDTLVAEGGGSERSWSLSFVDSKNLEHPSVTIKTKASIFERVRNYVKTSAVDHLNVAGSSALNLIFGVQALCHWIEYGFKVDTEGISNKSLATAIEVHFYVNAIGLMQGLGETGVTIGSLATNALKPYVKISLNLSSKLGGRVLLSMGRYASKALPVIGFIINATDLGLNAYELAHNDDPYQRPVLITNTVFSTAGLVVSTAAITASILGASAVAGPLGLIGLGIAVFSVPISYIVSGHYQTMQRANNVGLTIKSIVDEIKCGAYRKNIDGKFLAAPSFVAVKELKLSSSALQIAFGKINYQSTAKPNNSLTYRYHPEGEYTIAGDANHAKIPIDDTFRTLVMPYLPGYTFAISVYDADLFGAYQEDAVAIAKDLQRKDPNFKFQKSEGINKIASELYFHYERTNIDIIIQEDSWKLIFPWGDTAQAKNENDKKTIEASNKEIINRLEKISYNIKIKKPGRQSILLPAKECPVKLILDCSDKKSSWFIEFFEDSISDKDLKIEGNHINIGEKQNIILDWAISKVYLIVPKHQDSENQYEGMAYLDLRKNRYIYTKEVSQDEQKKAIFLFSTDEHAYFYLTKQSQGANSSEDMFWCVHIETKKVVSKHMGVKSLQKKGEGLLLVNNQGIIYYLSKDFKGQGLISQVIAFNDDWFNQRQNPLKALEDIDTFLKGKSHNPVVYLYLPYQTSNTHPLLGNILYYPQKSKYFILDARYTQAHFLRYDAFDQNAYFFAIEYKNIIAAKGMNRNDTSEKLEMHQGKVQIKSEETYEVLLKGVVKASVAYNGIRVHLSCGLVLLFHKELEGSTSPIHMNIEKIIFNDDFKEEYYNKIKYFLEIKTSKIQQEHLGDSIKGKTQIKQAAIITIEHKGKNIGFYDSSFNRTLSRTPFSKDQNVRNLSNNDIYIYSIIDNKQIYQSRWGISISEIKNGSDSDYIFFEGDAVELFDKTLFLKKDFMQKNFSDKLCTLSRFPELDLIWIESTYYSLELDSFENIALSSVDLSKNDPTMNIKLHIKNLEGYYLIRQNFDLCLYHPKRNFSFFFKEIFKPETITSMLAGVSLFIEAGKVDIPNNLYLPIMVNRYKKNLESLNVYGKIFYPKVTLIEILKRGELPEEEALNKNVSFNVVNLKKQFPYEIEIVNIHDKSIFFGQDGNINIYHHSASEAQKWATHTASKALENASAAVIGNKAIFFGGYGNREYSSAIDIYDNEKDKWTTAQASEARKRVSAAVIGQKAIFFGGFCDRYSSAIDIYDDNATEGQKWNKVQNHTPQARAGASVAVIDQKAIFFGGEIWIDTYSSAIDIYDAKENKWTTIKNHTPEARAGASVAVIGQKAIFFGGLNDKGYSSAIDVYDVKKNKWNKVTDHTPKARFDASVAVIGQKAIFFGGGQIGGNDSTSAIDIYDAKENKWTTIKAEECKWTKVAVIGQKAIFFGRFNGSSTIYIYDDQTDDWTRSRIEDINPFSFFKKVASAVNGSKALFIGVGKDNNAQMYVMEARYAL